MRNRSVVPGIKVRARILVSGKVQGVYYRQTTKEVASRNGLKGWVRNLADGRVEAVFEGDKESIDRTIEWCRTGPPNARVQAVDVSFEDYSGEFSDFRISY
ncbi:MAG TPA: acylphosphatase [Nitrososphaera sp.]